MTSTPPTPTASLLHISDLHVLTWLGCGCRGERYHLRTMDVALPDGSLFVGRYRIEHLIGEGPRKQTYLAWDPKARRQVALAVMLPGADPLATQREVEMLGKVCPHPNIVTLHEADLDAEPPYLVFEYIPGGELRDYFRNLQSPGPAGAASRLLPCRPSAMPGARAGVTAATGAPVADY